MRRPAAPLLITFAAATLLPGWPRTHGAGPAGTNLPETASRIRSDSPESAMARFDSLLNTGHPEAARALLTGPAERMFDLLLLSHQKLRPLIDTLLSKDSVVEKRVQGGRAVFKIKGKVVFTRSFMGLDSLHSVQAVQFLRLEEAWRISAFQELPSLASPMPLPTPADSAAIGSATGPATQPRAASSQPLGYFPVSSHGLAKHSRPDSIHYRAVLGHDGPTGPPANSDLKPFLSPSGPRQSLLRRDSSGGFWIACRKPRWPPGGFTFETALPDSLRPLLASTPYLDLQDTALMALSRRLRKQARHPTQYVDAVYRYLVSEFDFSLGATLFGTSREALRRMRGDCSEAAVLTSALLRAQGIPTRVAMGFASAGQGTFIGHAWCEAWVGEWIGIDAALKELPAGPQRLRLLASDGQGDLRVEATNLLFQVLGNIRLEMKGAWQGGKALALIPSPQDPQQGRRFFEEVLDGALP